MSHTRSGHVIESVAQLFTYELLLSVDPKNNVMRSETGDLRLAMLYRRSRVLSVATRPHTTGRTTLIGLVRRPSTTSYQPFTSFVWCSVFLYWPTYLLFDNGEPAIQEKCSAVLYTPGQLNWCLLETWTCIYLNEEKKESPDDKDTIIYDIWKAGQNC